MMTQNRLIGFGLIAALVIVLVPLGRSAAFGSIAITVLYAIMFAVGIWLSAPARSPLVRVGWATGLSIALVVIATFLNVLIAPGDEGGPVTGLIVFGFYLGLPTLFFAAVLSIAFKPGLAR